MLEKEADSPNTVWAQTPRWRQRTTNATRQDVAAFVRGWPLWDVAEVGGLTLTIVVLGGF